MRLRLRLVTSQGSPYPSRSPRAHPSGWTRTQGLSHRDSHASPSFGKTPVRMWNWPLAPLLRRAGNQVVREMPSHTRPSNPEVRPSMSTHTTSSSEQEAAGRRQPWCAQCGDASGATPPLRRDESRRPLPERLPQRCLSVQRPAHSAAGGRRDLRAPRRADATIDAASTACKSAKSGTLPTVESRRHTTRRFR